MLEAALYSSKAESKGKFKLPEEYDGQVNEPVLYQAVRAFLANQRQGTASTKNRARVAGGSQKPWRQKGTGRARQGTIRAAHWRGGGVVFGPSPRDFRVELPKRVRRLARLSAFNARASDGSLYVIQSLDFPEPKTCALAELLEKLGINQRNVLVLTAGNRPEVYLSGRNLPRVEVIDYAEANAYHLLWADAVVVEQEALEAEQGGRDRKAKEETANA